jgi:hypothetical protein
MNMPAKVSNALLRWLGLFGSIFIGLWVARQREPMDGIAYFETALVVTLVTWAIYCAVVYSVAFAWARLVKKNETAN